MRMRVCMRVYACVCVCACGVLSQTAAVDQCLHTFGLDPQAMHLFRQRTIQGVFDSDKLWVRAFNVWGWIGGDGGESVFGGSK